MLKGSPSVFIIGIHLTIDYILIILDQPVQKYVGDDFHPVKKLHARSCLCLFLVSAGTVKVDVADAGVEIHRATAIADVDGANVTVADIVDGATMDVDVGLSHLQNCQ